MQGGPSEAAVAVPRAKKQRTLQAIGAAAAAAEEAPVINIRSARAPLAAAPPSQQAAVGWRVRVRAQHDRRRMTDAVVRDYDPPTGARFDKQSVPLDPNRMLHCQLRTILNSFAL